MEFDLKGSLVGRLTRFNTLSLKVDYYFPKTLKDKNFLEIQKLFFQERDVLKIPTKDMREIKRIIEKDAAFLSMHNLIDYSLLIKVEKLPMNLLSLPNQSRNIFVAEDETEAYHLGVIDYLQEYTAKKHFEHLAKTRFGSHPKSDLVSCTSAPKYEARFTNFMKLQVFKRTIQTTIDGDGNKISHSIRESDCTYKKELLKAVSKMNSASKAFSIDCSSSTGDVTRRSSLGDEFLMSLAQGL